MEYADNGDLFQKILDHQKRGLPMNENEIWNIFIQVKFFIFLQKKNSYKLNKKIVKGLKALHNLKIFHRDLKVPIKIDLISLIFYLK